MAPVRIAILIAVRNRARLLEECLSSCVNQVTAPDKLIVIDGGSCDGSVDVIKRHADRITFWQSGPDRGIFDALNKGMAHLEPTDYVLVLGADDTLYGPQVIGEVKRRIEAMPGHSVYYGCVQMVELDGRDGSTRIEPWVVVRERFLRGLKQSVPHQAVFQRADSLKSKGGFDTRYRICGDYEALYRVLRREDPVDWNDFFIARMRRGGVSTAKGAMRRIYRERVAFCLRHALWRGACVNLLAYVRTLRSGLSGGSLLA